MEHLRLETLARMVDDTPTAAEAAHLEACEACAGELEALRRQTDELGSLPELRPPTGDWEVLEARMRSEGLMKDPGRLASLGLAHTPAWMRTAAAAVLFLGGTALGASLDGDGPLPGTSGTGADAVRFAEATTVEEAADAVRAAEESYVSALSRYRLLLARDGSEDDLADPASRFAALEYLVAAGQAAVRQAPADPFLNGLLASTLAERDATLRTISSSQDNWF